LGPACPPKANRGIYKSSALKLDREWTHRASGHLDEDVGQESMRLSIRIAGRSRGMCDTKTPPTQKYAAAPSTSAIPFGLNMVVDFPRSTIK
jgi:hypothetical protein